MAKTSPAIVKIEDREISLSNLEKVLWPDEKYTKAELIQYYAEIFSFIAPHLKDRPLVFTRYPNGIDGKSFYQKNAPDNLPGWINTFTWKTADRTIHMVIIKEKADLIWLANLACIEIHPWLSHRNSINNPDFMIFDLDPSPGNSFYQVRQIAVKLKTLLDSLGLRSYLKTSGAEGLHIYIPLVPRYSYIQVRNAALQIAKTISSSLPHLATIERTVNKRGQRIYIDYMQNVIGKTLCAPYSLRPRPGAPVSAPISWDELAYIHPTDFTIKNIPERASRLGDLFAAVLSDQQDLKFI